LNFRVIIVIVFFFPLLASKRVVVVYTAAAVGTAASSSGDVHFLGDELLTRQFALVGVHSGVLLGWILG